MPAAYTHKEYGQRVYQNLSSDIQGKIDPYRAYYDLGLHGPDILFFYLFYGNSAVMKKGYQMHYEIAREFFETARDKINNSKNKEAALAYILGFINHFVLDSECHGLINQSQIDLSMSHSELESELDARIMRQQELDHVSTKVTTHLHSNKIDMEVIAPFFEVKAIEVKRSVNTMVFLLDLFVAPSKAKRFMLYSIMRLTGMYNRYQGLIFNYHENKKSAEVVSKLVRKMDNALLDSTKCIEEYIELLKEDTSLSNRFDHDYEGS